MTFSRQHKKLDCGCYPTEKRSVLDASEDWYYPGDVYMSFVSLRGYRGASLGWIDGWRIHINADDRIYERDFECNEKNIALDYYNLLCESRNVSCNDLEELGFMIS